MTIKYIFSGIVQGIGFRPYAQRTARKLNISGEVKNSGGYVTITARGEQKALDTYIQCLVSRYDIMSYEYGPVSDSLCPVHDFVIAHSEEAYGTPFITPDIATCKECEKELTDKNDRRYNHPFISCVNCGPRYTIIKNLPYDRENTSMDEFNMCNICKGEYLDVDDRRCHAQTIACNYCGPDISISIDTAVSLLNHGDIVAVKGIGGYHLVCKANELDAVKTIRRIKGREEKPFALMFSSIEEIKTHCYVSEQEEKLLTSPARPIVLLNKKTSFADSVVCKSERIGAFLPCNPIQIMLLNKVSPLVMTSANISGEPIITNDDEIKKLNVPVLSHNRRILTPIDDSVMQIIADKPHFIRRARGYVPLAIDIGIKAKGVTFCAGGDLKAAFAYHCGNYVFMSQHFGDLENAKAFDAYVENVKRFADIHSFSATTTVVDKHPAYNSANAFDADIKIQHHKAHAASVIAEHKLKGDVLCFAFDGTGYGDDGAVWGSEVFTFVNNTFTRVNHFDYTNVPASDELAKDAKLCLDCYMGTNNIVNAAITHGINTVKTSSMGRLFDAVAALLGICSYNSYEGQCAIELEKAASQADDEYILIAAKNPKDILQDISAAVRQGISINNIALGFHMLVARFIAGQAKKYKIKQIALSGGVFNNKILTEAAYKLLTDNGFEPYINELVPCGDGGIALGQAYISAIYNNERD